MTEVAKNNAGWRTGLGALILLVLGAVLGYLGNDLISFRSDYRAQVLELAERAHVADEELKAALDPYVRALRGIDERPTDQDVDRLYAALQDLDLAVQRVSQNVASVRKEASAYREALLVLNRSITEFEDSYQGGRQLIESIANYLSKKAKFDEAVANETSRYFT